MPISSRILISILAMNGLSGVLVSPALAEEVSQVALLDSARIDKAGNFHYSYTVPGGCEKHEGEVQLELAADESRNLMRFVTSARILINDTSPGPDSCKDSSTTTVVGKTVNLQELLQRAADREGAMIEDRRISFTLPGISVFTGK